MRIAKVSPEIGDKLVVWNEVEGCRYLAIGRRRWFVLNYRDGSERHLEPHQARDLWYEVEEHDDCTAPCFYRWESEIAPASCMSCQLAQCLLGIGEKVRPDKIPPRRRRSGRDWRDYIILWLFAIVLALIASINRAASPAPPGKDLDDPPSKASERYSRRIGEGNR